jgi:hypothetical protein
VQGLHGTRNGSEVSGAAVWHVQRNSLLVNGEGMNKLLFENFRGPGEIST